MQTRHCVAVVGVGRSKFEHAWAALGVDIGEDEPLYSRSLGALQGLVAVGVKLLGVYVRMGVYHGVVG